LHNRRAIVPAYGEIVTASTHSIELRAAPADVWAFVSDLSSTPRWRTTVESIQAPSHFEVGIRMPATTRVLGMRWRWTIEITSIEPPRRLAYRTTGVATIDVEYVVDARPDGGSRFTFTGSSPSRLAVLARPTLDREARKALSNLQVILDGQQRPGA
jgi:carbon monoxide dehydrogenase subunit G